MVFILCLVYLTNYAQNPTKEKIDSLVTIVKYEKEFLKKIHYQNLLCEQLWLNGFYTKAKLVADCTLIACEAKLISAKENEQTEIKINIANAYNYIAIINRFLGNYPLSLQSHLKALKIREQIGDKKGIARSHIGIGTIYRYLGKYDEALKNEELAKKLYTEIGDKNGIANSYNHIGIIYAEQKKYDKAMANHLLSQKYWKETGLKYGITDAYIQIGLIHSLQKNFIEALKNYLSGLKLCQEIADKNGEAEAYLNIGIVHFQLNKIKDAYTDFYRGLAISKELGSKEHCRDIYQQLYRLDSATNKCNKEKENYKLYILYRDSIINQKSSEQITAINLQFDFDKKEAATKAEQNKKDLLMVAENKKHKLISVFVAIGLFFVLLFAGFIFRSLRITNKQKDIIEEKQKEILDSIEYALRIQTAILPPQKIVKQYLENSFILYKPKDIVAGDFYWIEIVNDLVLFAACDCTGHGVPGAMVSVVCHNALTRSVREFGLTQPATILDKTAEFVVENFSKSEEDIKDGMDISLCAFDPKTKTLQWAGANNPLWLLQNGLLKETKADKQPIGRNEHSKPFTNHTFNLNLSDTIYLFTDGYADQFGGETGEKKLTKKRFKDLILSVQNKSMQEQGIALDKFITDYRNSVEQIDDILVIGVKIR